MENDTFEEGGISLGYIFRTIFSQKWLALIIAAAITLVGTLGLYFMGSRKLEYTTSFVLQLPKTSDTSASTSYTYPDGTSFYYTDLISQENLENVAAKEEFAGIDVGKMIKNGDISISRAVDRVDEQAQGGVYDLNYVIKVKAKYFKTEETARAFIVALTEIPRTHISNMVIDYDSSLTASKSAITYEEQLNLLKSQAEYIKATYDKLIENHGEEFVVAGGKTLAQCSGDLNAYLGRNPDPFDELKSCAADKGYVKSSDLKEKYGSDIYDCQRKLDVATKALEELQKSPSGGTSVLQGAEAVELAREIGELTKRLTELTNYQNSCDNPSCVAPAEFENEVKKVEDKVTEFTNTLKQDTSYLYGRVTKINYLNSKVVAVEGGMSVVMSLVISLVAGIFIAAIVAYIVGWNKQKKSTKKAVAQDMPSEGGGELTLNSDEQEALSEAATADESDKK